jgi:hypothetical protein
MLQRFLFCIFAFATSELQSGRLDDLMPSAPANTHVFKLSPTQVDSLKDQTQQEWVARRSIHDGIVTTKFFIKGTDTQVCDYELKGSVPLLSELPDPSIAKKSVLIGGTIVAALGGAAFAYSGAPEGVGVMMGLSGTMLPTYITYLFPDSFDYTSHREAVIEKKLVNNELHISYKATKLIEPEYSSWKKTAVACALPAAGFACSALLVHLAQSR